MMQCNMVIYFVLLSVMSPLAVVGSSILVLSPITTPSHSNFFQPVVKAFNSWPGSCRQLLKWIETKQRVNGKQDGKLESSLLPRTRSNQQRSSNRIRRSRQSVSSLIWHSKMAVYCTAIYQNPIFHQLLKSKNVCDLIIIEGAFNEYLLPLVQLLDVPFIYMIGIASPPWLMDAIGSSLALDHFPHPGSNYVGEMNIWQRFYNTLSGFVVVHFHRWFIMSVVDRTASKMLNFSQQMQPAEEIQSKYLSLLISNTHFIINYQLPTWAAEIQAGGLHCGPSNPLPEVV